MPPELILKQTNPMPQKSTVTLRIGNASAPALKIEEQTPWKSISLSSVTTLNLQGKSTPPA